MWVGSSYLHGVDKFPHLPGWRRLYYIFVLPVSTPADRCPATLADIAAARVLELMSQIKLMPHDALQAERITALAAALVAERQTSALLEAARAAAVQVQRLLDSNFKLDLACAINAFQNMC